MTTNKVTEILATVGDHLTRPLKSALIGALTLIAATMWMIGISALIFGAGVLSVHLGKTEWASTAFAVLAVFSVAASINLVVKAGKYGLSVAAMTLLIDKLDGVQDIQFKSYLEKARAAVGGLAWYVFGCMVIASLPLRAWSNVLGVTIALVALGSMLLAVLAGWYDGGNGKWIPMWGTILTLAWFLIISIMPAIGNWTAMKVGQWNNAVQSNVDAQGSFVSKASAQSTTAYPAPAQDEQPAPQFEAPPEPEAAPEGVKPSVEGAAFLKNADCNAVNLNASERIACLKAHQTWTATATAVSTRPSGGYAPHAVPTAAFDPNEVLPD